MRDNRDMTSQTLIKSSSHDYGDNLIKSSSQLSQETILVGYEFLFHGIDVHVNEHWLMYNIHMLTRDRQYKT